MISLAIDTSAHLCAAAVHDSAGDTILAQASEDIGRGHAERLMDVIAGVLRQAGIEYSNIQRVTVTTGPGSFTGIRVGLATARGIALGLGIDACGVSVLEAAALAVRDRAAGPLIAVMDARRGEAYCQVFDSKEDPQAPFVASYHQLLPLLAGRARLACCAVRERRTSMSPPGRTFRCCTNWRLCRSRRSPVSARQAGCPRQGRSRYTCERRMQSRRRALPSREHEIKHSFFGATLPVQGA